MLDKHRQHLPDEVLKALKELDTVVKEAASTHSAAAKGKLHYFLQEDLQVQRLRCAADALHSLVSSLVKLSSYQAPDLKADVQEVASKLSSSRCNLPAHQLQLIEEFRTLAWQLDPAAEISDGMHKSAEQVVRKVIIEVHGPFFNAEILDKELTHLEKAATRLDPVAQRAEAASVKLLASALLQLDGDEPVDDDYDSLAPSCGIDPFSVPSFAPVMRVVDPATPPLQQPAGVKQLTIQLAGDDHSPASSPSACGTGWYSPLQHLQQPHGALLDMGPASPGQAVPAAVAMGSSCLGNSIAGSLSSSRPGTASVVAAGAAAVVTEASEATTATTVGGPRAAAAAAAAAVAIADAAAATAAGAALHSSTTANSIAGPGAAAAAWAAAAAAGPAPSPSVVTIPSSSVADQQQQQRQRWAADLQQQRLQGAEPADAQLADSPSAAAPSQLLDEFIASSSNQGSRDSRKACVFHAQMRLPPEGLQRLAGFLEVTARVRGLSLAHNWIGPDGMQRLCDAMRVNKSVRMLDLQDNRLGDAGACALAALIADGAKLSSLQLCSNDIGDDGMVALAQAISKGRCLEKLSIYNNSIGARGCQALTAAVAATPGLKVVEFLPGNCAPTKDVKALARAVKANRKFNICHLFGKQRATRAS
uniref:Uncharacterized protein n=1 Tax=Tetradesmus obliquus TaxID=3088 RepID=A0A383WHE7_TETOB|eukprot:jgi/Sobl393_1/2488/SZX76870.1